MIQALASSGAALSFFLLLVLAVKRPFRPADSWLAIWFLAQCVFCVCVLLGLAAPARAALAALMVGQFAIFVTWPAHYLYAASALGASPRPARHAALAAAVAVLVFALPMVVPIRVEAGAMVTDGSLAMAAAPAAHRLRRGIALSLGVSSGWSNGGVSR